jgi:hypothetical protein
MVRPDRTPQIPRLLCESDMSKTQRIIKKANHGQRPANSKARRAKRRQIKT